ncbi:MAG TPA: hypothetical protein VLK22_04095 [Candidatus Udaeobacter sp.]|nr:hypothetical protein [Candidatus Udaeobacter sp.]
MASSKWPVDPVPVSESISSLVRRSTAVFCKADDSLIGYFGSVVGPIEFFLRCLPKNCMTKLVVHFQGFGEEVGTMVVNTRVQLWSGENIARLTFDDPQPDLRCLGGGPNFWSPFIIAIACAHENAPVCFHKDGDASKFISLASDLSFMPVGVVELLKQYEKDIIYDAHSFGTKVQRSDAGKQILAFGLQALPKILSYLGANPPTEEEVSRAWASIISRIAVSHKLHSPHNLLLNLSAWTDWAKNVISPAPVQAL